MAINPNCLPNMISGVLGDGVLWTGEVPPGGLCQRARQCGQKEIARKPELSHSPYVPLLCGNFNRNAVSPKCSYCSICTRTSFCSTVQLMNPVVWPLSRCN